MRDYKGTLFKARQPKKERKKERKKETHTIDNVGVCYRQVSDLAEPSS